MKLFRDGDCSRAFCSHCAKVVKTVFVRRDVPFSDGNGTAKNILVGACEVCDAVVSIPAQSTPAIAEARRCGMVSLEASLPAIYVDVLDLAAHRISPDAMSEFRKPLLSYFLHRFAHKSAGVRQLRRAHELTLQMFPEERGGLKRRLSLKVSPTVADDVNWLVNATELSTTELLKSMVYEIHQQVLETPKPTCIRDLQTIATFAGR
jgi:hypothetical protein